MSTDVGMKETSSVELTGDNNNFEMASQWKLMFWKFTKHKLAVAGLIVVVLLYLIAIFADFLAPYDPHMRTGHVFSPPQLATFITEDGFSLKPVTYGLTQELDMETFQRKFVRDTSKEYPVQFFVRGSSYKFLWFETDLHLFGAPEGGVIYLMGTDSVGRDIFSRTLHGARISLSIGLIGVLLSLTLGLIFGGISGYYGGTVDNIIQRITEILRSFPTIPLWMALAAAIPRGWPPEMVYLAMTAILSLLGWTGLARVVRGKLLSIRDEDFVHAARLAGASEARVIRKHLLPSFTSHIIASTTRSIPGMVLSETSLSFLGLGLQAPTISWGVLLQAGQNINTIMMAPWMMYPAIFVVVTVLAFNFAGDGLRDAADPYTNVS